MVTSCSITWAQHKGVLIELELICLGCLKRVCVYREHLISDTGIICKEVIFLLVTAS